ncbi:TetR/AcrR family transcriptional regulator [Streptomyces sp. CA-278952]|uniref:TetR/AcrR family transcriptional regulator n=1 Tax=unclassified Streptomyces TaxID=2593676 RepID=UPI002241A7E2|nr:MULTISPECIES: TetR/AcrR family transcriptional regulator [unclassified Streptomyces]UZI27690.1 TetR/AcrR family transcriptional regulator [Streptomyces sp. VB1]WDG27882.1 TetR/AcrR family transcriptional regulator [Streptomyces sp. CA-278952]
MARRVDPAARRDLILKAAVRVFARQGFAATRVDDVAAEAGVAKGSVYLHFDSRDALLTAAFEEYRAHARAVTRQARTGPGDGLERLSRLVRSVLDMVVAEPELARILVDLWAAGRQGGPLGLDISAVYREYRAVIAELLAEAEAEGACRAGVGAGHAVVVVGAIEGCLVQWIVDPTLPVAELTAPLLDVCVEGLRRGGAE